MKKYVIAILAVLIVFTLMISVFADSRDIKPDKEASEDKIEQNRILLLERALEPKDPNAAVKAWAEGVKTRNGALQYAVMSPDLKKENYSDFVGLGWVTGVSSPWIDSYKINQKYRRDNDTYRFRVEFTYTDSTKSFFTTEEYVTVSKINDAWLISAIEKADVIGEITKLTAGKDKKLQSLFVEAVTDAKGSYDKANVTIGSDTKIYEGYTDKELSASDLKKGTKVSVTFTDDPRIMIYPVSAKAKIIRIIDETLSESTEPKDGAAEQLHSIAYENTKYGFTFMLPGSWENFDIVINGWEGLSIGDPKGDKVVETGTIINIRSPLWTVQEPRQDIPIMIFTTSQWNSLTAEKFHIGAAPVGPREIGRSSKYVFALPARYNFAYLPGTEEVEKILDNDPIKAGK